MDDPVEGTELPRAYIIRRDPDSTTPSEKEVHLFMRERLAKYKQLMGGVVFTRDIPKNASGKILKRILRGAGEEGDGGEVVDMTFRVY